MVRPLSAYTREDEALTFSFTLYLPGNYEHRVTFAGYYDLSNDALVLDRVTGRAGFPRPSANTVRTVRTFKEIARSLAELTGQDPSFSCVLVETLA